MGICADFDGHALFFCHHLECHLTYCKVEDSSDTTYVSLGPYSDQRQEWVHLHLSHLMKEPRQSTREDHSNLSEHLRHKRKDFDWPSPQGDPDLTILPLLAHIPDTLSEEDMLPDD